MVPAMTEDVQKLRETLATLHEELGTTETADPEVRILLANSLLEISAKLLAHEAGTPVESLPPHGLGDLARQIEVEHPTFAATLRGVVESLARMGI